MVYISCIIRATILRCDYPVLYVPRFFVVSTTILASILRCDLTFAKMSTLAFADGHKHDVISGLLVNIATNWTVLHSHPFKMSIRCDNMIIKLQDFMFSSFKISLRCSKSYHTATPVMSHDSYTKWLGRSVLSDHAATRFYVLRSLRSRFVIIAIIKVITQSHMISTSKMAA